MFRKKQVIETTPQDIQRMKLMMVYSDHCASTCLNNFESGLDRSDEKCLAKCLDRAADYLRLAQARIESTEKK